MYALTFGRDLNNRWSTLSGGDTGELCEHDDDCNSGNCWRPWGTAYEGTCIPRLMCGANAHAEVASAYTGLTCVCNAGYTGDPLQGCVSAGPGPQDFHSAACTNSGGTWDSSSGTCGCPYGATLDPVSARCIFEAENGCMTTGGTWNGSSCDCGSGSFWDTIDNVCSGPRQQCTHSGGTYDANGNCTCKAPAFFTATAADGPGCYKCPPSMIWQVDHCGCGANGYYDQTAGTCKPCASNPGQCFSSGAPLLPPPPIAPHRVSLHDVEPGPPPPATTGTPAPSSDSRTALYIALAGAAVISAVGLGWVLREDRRL